MCPPLAHLGPSSASNHQMSLRQISMAKHWATNLLEQAWSRKQIKTWGQQFLTSWRGERLIFVVIVSSCSCFRHQPCLRLPHLLSHPYLYPIPGSAQPLWSIRSSSSLPFPARPKSSAAAARLHHDDPELWGSKPSCWTSHCGSVQDPQKSMGKSAQMAGCPYTCQTDYISVIAV